jgi:CubicO group peptidase (beta-lactamase class C family)
MHRLPVFVIGLSFSLVTHADTISQFIEAQMDEKKIPGLAFAITKNAELVRQGVFGVANVEFQVPVDENTVFPIASITKTFTTVAILSLVEQGEFGLDDSVTRLLPQLPEHWSRVSIRHCLTHTSGLPDTRKPGTFEPVAGTVDDMLSVLATKPTITPGTTVSYNQTGFLILKLVIEKITERPFEEHLEKRFFDPLGMVGTSFGDYREVIPNRTSIYTMLVPDLDRHGPLPGPLNPDDPFSGVVVSEEKIFKDVYTWPIFQHAGAGLNSSITDLIKWDLALSKGKIVPMTMLHEAGIGFSLADGSRGLFGLGWAVRGQGARKVVQMGGGWVSWHLRVPSEGLGVIILTNLQGAERGEIANGVADLYMASVQE